MTKCEEAFFHMAWWLSGLCWAAGWKIGVQSQSWWFFSHRDRSCKLTSNFKGKRHGLENVGRTSKVHGLIPWGPSLDVVKLICILQWCIILLKNISIVYCKVLEITLIPGLYYTAAEWCFLKSHILCFHFVIDLVKNSMSKG